MADILYTSKQQPYGITSKMLFQLICYQAITKSKITSQITFMRTYNNWQKSAFIITSNFFFFWCCCCSYILLFILILKNSFGQTNICICFICGYMHYIYYMHIVYIQYVNVYYMYMYIYIYIYTYLHIY